MALRGADVRVMRRRLQPIHKPKKQGEPHLQIPLAEASCLEHDSGMVGRRFPVFEHCPLPANAKDAMTPTAMILVVAAPLLAWRLYARMRRLVGRQALRLRRSWLAAILFPLLIVLLASASMSHPLSLLGIAGGTLAGLVLAAAGLKLTRFENTPAGLFYTPNAHIGIALSLLFTGRILYRFLQLYQISESGAPPAAADFANSPLTLLIFAMMAAYFAAYAVGILRWRHGQRSTAGNAADGA
jgi:hypothetical protein